MQRYLSTAIRVMLALERNTAMHWMQPIALHSQDQRKCSPLINVNKSKCSQLFTSFCVCWLEKCLCLSIFTVVRSTTLTSENHHGTKWFQFTLKSLTISSPRGQYLQRISTKVSGMEVVDIKRSDMARLAIRIFLVVNKTQKVSFYN